MINERIHKLQTLMKERDIAVYFIPTSDFHDSEYVGEHFQVRKYMSGFTGSAGVMAVTQNEAHLWSDGRYYIQAEKQTKDSEVIFHRQGEAGVISPLEFIDETLQSGETLAVDGRTITVPYGTYFSNICEKKNAKLIVDIDLVNEIWSERPPLPKDELYVYDVKYSGESTSDKLTRIRSAMSTYGAKAHLITSLDDIAYTLNLRGNDIACTPVFLSYLYIGEDDVTLYVDNDKITKDVSLFLDELHIQVRNYSDIYADIKHLDVPSILIDPSKVNYTLFTSIPKKVQVIRADNPSIIMKAVKNDIEIENTRLAHIKDGVAVTKFMYWLKNNVGKIDMDEVSVADYLEDLRRQQDNFVELSFDTISAYNANAASAHYKAEPNNKATIIDKGMLLVDSGGNYLEGTTDITRTFKVGDVSDEWKKHFTLVLQGNINLGTAKFLFGVTGVNLDILARQPLWEHGLDYKHGTGHGVGHFLGVHEGPHNIRWQAMSTGKRDAILQPGMIVSNEPGYYVDGSHGIRIENLVVVQEDKKVGNDEFLQFETLTFVPIDIDLIDKQYLDEKAIAWLNDYHKEVYEKISPFLSDEENEWLKKYTRAI